MYSKTKYKLKQMPKLVKEVVDSGTKKHCQAFYDVLLTGLKKDNFSLKRLSKLTHSIRKGKGYSTPQSPLLGRSHSRTLVNNLEIVKQGQRWVLQPNNKIITNRTTKKTYKISVKKLWAIHENGLHGGMTYIPVTYRMRMYFKYALQITLKANVLKIPARHVLKKTLKRYLGQMKKTNKEISKDLADRIRKVK